MARFIPFYLFIAAILFIVLDSGKNPLMTLIAFIVMLFIIYTYSFHFILFL